ncbi:hypothetical protein HETIRDRAFT_319258 [Heterobasidion irregulare TC 32-1]|uniref:Uncharacterized protein n=1 Tax=Heterobasidion irregulare (strain TC 32-1) TaxID=747525 RepID=W4K7C0_HETIT|nr:uncharacterized protein HETIRDRAFT_319258 [Heterobasidion irregulare TC 32-1]XP_009553093.1 uncharacterized protein HETIRDRAFT_332079 [Heterobasidion irregulare TC 32-1]ETW74587.1 hypothetical protein HETIRDRAFT_332079 [Heterobasidion irregulare TC 32-1]ETW81230.1 hypothetical protein HETIRDRAFT_319258 [Heterobasidion irregulare TC 32-1]
MQPAALLASLASSRRMSFPSSIPRTAIATIPCNIITSSCPCSPFLVLLRPRRPYTVAMSPRAPAPASLVLYVYVRSIVNIMPHALQCIDEEGD